MLTSKKAIKLYPGLFLVLFYGYQTWDLNHYPALLAVLGDVALLLIPVYTHILFLIPRVLRQKKYVLYIIGFIGVVLFTGFLPTWLDWFLAASRQPVYINISNAIVLSVLALGYDFTIDYFRQQKRQRALERQQLETEVQMLRMQLNPHFLFNTLNNLYGLALTKSDHLPDLMLQLSELLRYLHDEGKKSKVELDKELNFLSHYIQLQKVRLPNHVTVNFEKTGNSDNLTIAPALLINFLDNAFKHLNSESLEAFVDIRIEVTHQQLIMDIRNSKTDEQQENQREGTGLSNMQRRLALLYPGKYEFQVMDEGQAFRAYLKLHLS